MPIGKNIDDESIKGTTISEDSKQQAKNADTIVVNMADFSKA